MSRSKNDAASNGVGNVRLAVAALTVILVLPATPVLSAAFVTPSDVPAPSLYWRPPGALLIRFVADDAMSIVAASDGAPALESTMQSAYASVPFGSPRADWSNPARLSHCQESLSLPAVTEFVICIRRAIGNVPEEPGVTEQMDKPHSDLAGDPRPSEPGARSSCMFGPSWRIAGRTSSHRDTAHPVPAGCSSTRVRCLLAIILAVAAGTAFAVFDLGRPLSIASRTSSGVPADDAAIPGAISDDGRFVAFYSAAGNLQGSPAGVFLPHQVYVHDRLTGALELVSATPSGTPSDGDAVVESMSADGRVVTFVSDASDLGTGDDNHAPDVYVRDRQTRTTQRIAIPTVPPVLRRAGTQPALSADGRYLVFTSIVLLSTLPLQPADQIVLVDRETGATEVVSLADDGTPSDGAVQAAVSGDAGVIAFSSTSDFLVPGDDNGHADVFVRDRVSGRTERVSVSTTGQQADGDCWGSVVSRDGRVVAFWSDATTLVPDDGNGVTDVFVHDRMTHVTERVSVSRQGGDGDGASPHPSYPGSLITLSADGRYVAFSSEATNLVDGDLNGWDDIFVRDRLSGETTLISVQPSGIQSDWYSWEAVLSADARSIAFATGSPVFTGRRGAVLQTFVRSIGTCEGAPYRPWEGCPEPTTTTTVPVTTTTTLPRCTAARCVLEEALAAPVCVGERVPARVRRAFDKTADLVLRAEGESPRRRARLLGQARRLLRGARASARRAASRPRRPLAAECVAAIVDAVADVSGRITTPRS